jgi:hypothetical protein
MITFAVIMTRRDFTEGTAYLSDDFYEASGMGQVMVANSPGQYIRAWVKTMSVSRRRAAQFWAEQGDVDGRKDVACPLVPKMFAAVYQRHFAAGRKAATQG